ncbi:MAG TPA: YdeI/OmpD-associated family protein [Bacteroidia bacterium]|nr:YdeI/OmpD-associated family protein [Bacteroidia bacterium]
MPKDKRIDEYISNAQPFAQPILKHLRELVHKANPEVTETIKWGMPSFEYKGPYFGIASFKQHCVAGFWKHKLLKDPKGYLGEIKSHGGEAMGNLGRMTSINDLPPDKVMLGFFKQAKKLNDDGVKMERPKAKLRKEIPMPKEFASALSKNKKASRFWRDEKFPPSHKREYLEWITEAKTEETKNNRIATTLGWLSEGKSRNWKYMKK